MKKIIDVFYEFTCPFCYKGLKQLYNIVGDRADVELNFMPCETHPYPGFAVIHSYKAARLVYFLKDKGLDVKKFNDLIYDAHFEKKLSIDDDKLLKDFAVGLGAKEDEVYELVNSDLYADILSKNNELVWNELSIDAVPSYRLGDKLAASRAGVLVSESDIKSLIGIS